MCHFFCGEITSLDSFTPNPIPVGCIAVFRMDFGGWRSPVAWCVSVGYGLGLAAFKRICYHCTRKMDADMESASLSLKNVWTKTLKIKKDSEKFNTQSCVLILLYYGASLTVRAAL